MHIWVDADACPLVIKEILFRAAERLRISLTLVANRKLRTPASSYIQSLRVEPGLEMADRYIVLHARPNDLVVTADIPLAAEVIARGGYALNPRGILYSRDNISFHLVTRDADGNSQEPSLLSQAERQDFANQLDRFLMRQTG